MDTNSRTETRVEYHDPETIVRPVALKSYYPHYFPNLPDWTASKKFPFVLPIYRKLYEERSLQPSGNTHDTWNDFEHYKMLSVLPNEATTYYTVTQGSSPYGHTFVLPSTRWLWRDTEFGPPDKPIKGLPVLYEKNNVTGKFVKLIPDINTLINVAVRQMLGQSRPETSLINSVLELKDIKSLPRHTASALAMLKTVKKELPIALQGVSAFHWKIQQKSLMRVLGVLSGALLQSEFNLRPLYKDLVVILESLRTAQKQLLKRIANEGIHTRRDFNIDLMKDFVDSNTLSASYANPGSSLNINFNYPSGMIGTCRLYRSVRYTHRQFHAQVIYSQFYSEAQKHNALLLGLLDRVGVMFDPSIVWNAIPWSFAIDWVVGVNQWLSQFRSSNMEPVTLIHKFCWSQHVRRIVTTTVQPQPLTTPPYRGSDRIASSVVEDAYIRNTQRLNVVAALAGSGLNSREFILASALKLSRQR